jgi:predicted phosphodiesterase
MVQTDEERKVNKKKSQKILAISDTILIPEYRRMVDYLQPDIVVLAGDFDEPLSYFENFPSEHDVKKYFYDFLHYAGTKSKVLVIKGNHDDSKYSDNSSYYSINKINRINGCTEISGRFLKINGLNFLGINYESARINANLFPILEKYGNDADVIISHADVGKVPHFTKFKPMVVINGHSRGGVYSVNDISVVLTNNVGLVLIEIKQNNVKKILEYQFIKNYVKVNGQLSRGVDVLSNSPKKNSKNYDWLKKFQNKRFRKIFIPLHN